MVKKYSRKKPNVKKFKGFNQRNAREMGYDSTWEKYRRRFLYHNPNCATCPGRSKVVDHLIAHKGDRELFTKLDNHIPLCEQCHNIITGKFDRHKEPDIEGKVKWINKQRELYNIKRAVKVLRYYEK